MRRLFPEPAELDDDGLVDAYRLPAGRSLRVNFVASLDGAVTVAGRSEGLGSPGDKRIFDLLRALTDAVLVGSGTAAAEGYGPMRAETPVGRLRAFLGRAPTAPVVVVSGRAAVPARLIGGTSPTICVTCESADAERRDTLDAAGVRVLVCGQDDVDLTSALDRLAGLGHEQVLCEGGPGLLRAALTAGVVDELDLTTAPALVGGEARLLGEALPDVVRLDLRQLLEEDGVLFSRYAVLPPA
ncbi:MAG: putative bifunctional deaminase-reductase [Blastococcus sp.]|nr:putative bifunctional deaminase-reductase [Blastococcus sp.]